MKKILFLLTCFFIYNIVANAYEVGHLVNYHGNMYYLISDNDNYFTLMKKEPLTKDEINKYGEGHINNHTKYKSGDSTSDRIYEKEVIDDYEIARVAFYQSESCGYDIDPINDDCKNNYNISEVKYIVDAWANDNVEKNDLVNDNTGLSVRLITIDELQSIFGYAYKKTSDTSDEYSYIKADDTPEWIYEYYYWTMSASNDSDSVYEVNKWGKLDSTSSNRFSQIRPVISVLKPNMLDGSRTYYVNSSS